jgi:hypothetical protein
MRKFVGLYSEHLAKRSTLLLKRNNTHTLKSTEKYFEVLAKSHHAPFSRTLLCTFILFNVPSQFFARLFAMACKRDFHSSVYKYSKCQGSCHFPEPSSAFEKSICEIRNGVQPSFAIVCNRFAVMSETFRREASDQGSKQAQRLIKHRTYNSNN